MWQRTATVLVSVAWLRSSVGNRPEEDGGPNPPDDTHGCRGVTPKQTCQDKPKCQWDPYVSKDKDSCMPSGCQGMNHAACDLHPKKCKFNTKAPGTWEKWCLALPNDKQGCWGVTPKQTCQDKPKCQWDPDVSKTEESCMPSGCQGMNHAACDLHPKTCKFDAKAPGNWEKQCLATAKGSGKARGDGGGGTFRVACVLGALLPAAAALA